jgi:hypothetical protein
MEDKQCFGNYIHFTKILEYNLVFKSYYTPSFEHFDVFNENNECIGIVKLFNDRTIMCWYPFCSYSSRVIYSNKIDINRFDDKLKYDGEGRLYHLQQIAKIIREEIDKEKSDQEQKETKEPSEKITEKNEITTRCTDFDEPFYKLYLITTDYGYKDNDFYIVAKDPTDAENILTNEFAKADMRIKITNIKVLT